MGEIRPLQLTPAKPLSDTATLWRYVPLKTLFLYLSGKIFIPSVETLRKGDPFEAEFYYDDHPAIFNSALDAWYGDIETILKWIFDSRLESWQQRIVRPNPAGLIDYNQSFFYRAYFEFIRATRYAWCWFAPESGWESAAMWNLYGKEGIAVITKVAKLTQALTKTGRDFEFGRLHYVHANENGIVANAGEKYPGGSRGETEVVLRPHFLKRAEYQSEHEVRFVTADCEHSAGGIVIELPPQDWIEEMRLWPGLSSSETTALKELIESRLPQVPCERSGMLKNADDEVVAALAAEYTEIPWRAGDDTDGIPSGLKRLWPTDSKAAPTDLPPSGT